MDGSTPLHPIAHAKSGALLTNGYFTTRYNLELLYEGRKYLLQRGHGMSNDLQRS